MFRKILQFPVSFAMRSSRWQYLRLFVGCEILAGLLGASVMVCGVILWLLITILQAMNLFDGLEFINASIPLRAGFVLGVALAVFVCGIGTPVVFVTTHIARRVDMMCERVERKRKVRNNSGSETIRSDDSDSGSTPGIRGDSGSTPDSRHI